MNLNEKIQRSRSEERIDFSKIKSIDQKVPLVKLESSGKILVEPNWTLENDFEGSMYADYIAEHPEYDGVYVRSELAKRLKNAANNLDEGYRLIIRAGHRPIAVQKRLLKECAEDFKRDNPGVSDEEALAHARTYVSDPDVELPPHVCGAAVDVDVLDTKTNQLLDFGSKVNDDNEKSSLYYPNLTSEQKANRLMLVTAMVGAGLASCKPEWWHYSYGDQVWAWFYGHKDCLYSPVGI